MSNIALGLYKYVDGVNDIPFPSSANQAYLTGWQYNAKRMGGAPSITGGTIIYHECLDDMWDDSVCVKYKGECYFSTHTPTSSYSSQSIMYEHKADFLSERAVLDNVYFYDVVSEEDSGGKPVSNSTHFVFNGTIAEFIARINASLAYSSVGYSVVLDNNQAHSDEIKLVKFDSKFISEVLQEGFKIYGIPYYFADKICHFGDKDSSSAVLDNVIFRYGEDASLLSLSKNNANNRIVNRITGVGSKENIPYYYPNSCEKGIAEIRNLESETITNIEVFDDERFAAMVAQNSVLVYDEYEDIPVDVSAFYMDNEAYDKDMQVELAEKDVHVIVPVTIGLDCDGINFRIDPWIGPSRPGHYVTYSNVQISPAIPDASIAISQMDGYIDITSSSLVPKGTYKISFDAAFTEIASPGNFCNGSYRINATAWYDEAKDRYYQDLNDIGLIIGGNPSLGDSFKQVIETLIPYQSNLMPSIYRISKGEERFYNAKNYPFLKPTGYVLDEATGEYEDGGYVFNDNYTNAGGDYYDFHRPYVEGRPRENIQSNEDIKPSIKGMVNGDGQPIDEVIKFAFDANDNDEMDEQGNYLHPYFFALLHKTDGQYGFNLFDQANEKDQMSLNFNTGRLGGCNFLIGVSEESQSNTVQIELDANLEPVLDEDGHPILKRDENGDVLYGLEGRQTKQVPQAVQNDTRNNEVWVALKKDTTTYDEVMPNVTKNYMPDDDDPQGNIFVILNITLPKAYKLAAEQALTNYLIATLSEENSEQWNFAIDFSRIYLDEESTIADAIDENKKIKIEYNGKIYERYVLSYTYKTLLNESLPSINVELAEQLITSANPIDSAISQVTNLVEVQANAIIGYQQVARLARLALPSSNVQDIGNRNRPIYFNGNKAKEIEGLDVPEDIRTDKNLEAKGGVSANGYADLSFTPNGGGGTATAVEFDSNVPYNEHTAYSPSSEGLIKLPAYPSLAGLASEAWVQSHFAAKGYETRVQAIEGLIPSQATSSNQLADKAFVNSSIATATATYQGSYNLVSDLSLTTSATRAQIATALASAISGEDNNDYAFVEIPTSDSTPTQIARVERYKYNGSAWEYEYTLNNSGMTAAQWAAVNSGITASKVSAYDAHVASTSNPHNVTKAQVGLGNVENTALSTWDGTTNINTLGTVTTGVWHGTAIEENYIAKASAWNAKYDKPSGGIPKTDLAQGVQDSLGLADTALQSHQTIYNLIIKKNGTQVGSTYNPATAAQTIDITDVASANALSGVATRVGNLEGYFDANGVANNAAKLGGQLPSYYAVAADYTKTTDFKSLTIKGGTTSVGTYSPTSALTFSIVAGTNISVTPDATNHKITIANTYALPTASSSVKGGIKVGSTLTILDEVLNAKEATASQAGIVNTGTQTFAGNKTLQGNFQATGGVAADGYADLSIGGNGGGGSVSALRINSGTAFTPDANGLISLTASEGSVNGAFLLGGESIPIHGLQALAYKSSILIGDHYSPVADAGSQLSASASGASAAWSIDVVKAVQVQRDSKGHVVGITVTSGKIPAKPTYAFSNLTSHPTTLGGYGITDAKIENGVITLGSNTITPLTGINATMINTALGFTLSGTSGQTYNLATISSNASNGNTAYGYFSNGVLPASKGGTGKTSLSDAGSAIINALGEGSSPATRNDYIVAQYAGGGTTTTTYHRRKLSNVFAALNSSDITTALGYTPYNATNPNGYISGNQTITLSGDVSGSGATSIAVTIGAGKVTNTMLAGSIANSKLASAGKFTIGSTAIELGTTHTAANFRSYLGLGGAATYGATSSVTDGGTSLVTSGGVYSYVNALLTAAMKIEGETTTAISDGSTTNPVTIGGQSVNAYKGMVVFYGSKEFVWVGTNWKELGDESSFALKTTTVSGTGYLTGGGALSSNQTIDIASSVKTKIDNGATAYGWGNHADAGYALAANLGTASTHAHGDYVTGMSWDSTNNKLAWSKGGTAQTAITIGYATNADYAKATRKINAQINFSVGASGNNKYRKIGTITITNRYSQTTGTLHYYSGLSTSNNTASTGFLYINAYQQNPLGQSAMVTFKQLGDTQRFKFYAVEQVSSTSTVIDIYATIDYTYHGISIAQISGTMSLSDGGEWLDELPEGTRTITPSFTARVGTAEKLSNTAAIGSASIPVYFSANGVPVACDLSTTYAPYNANGYLPLSGGTMTGAITMGKNPIRFSTSNDSDWNIGEDSSSSHLRILNALGTAGTGAVATYSVALSVKGYYGFQLACKSSRNEFCLRDLRNGASDPRDWQIIFTSANSNLSTVDWATKKLTASDQIVSNVATGTAPLVVASTTRVANLNADLLDGYEASALVKYDGGAAEQTIKSSISSLSKGVINLWRNSGDHYTFLGFSNGTTETYLGGIGFKSQSDHNLYRKDGGNYYKIWDENNDGADSGLNADLLDGQHGSYYATASSVTTLQGYFSNGVAKSAAKLTTVSKTAWGRTYWTSGGVPDNISGDMSNVGDIAFQASGKNIGGIAYFDTTNARLGIGMPNPTHKLHVDGDVCAEGGMSANGYADLSIGGGSGAGSVAAISVGGTAYTPDASALVTIPVSATGNTLQWGTATKIADIGGLALNVTLPANPNTHYSTGITAGASGTTSNSQATDPYIKIKDDSTHRGEIRLIGTQRAGVSSDANGNIYISVNDKQNVTTSSNVSSLALKLDYTVTQYQIHTCSSTSYLSLSLTRPNLQEAGVIHYLLIVNSTNSQMTITMPSGTVLAPAKTVKIPSNSAMEISYLYDGTRLIMTWSQNLVSIN